MVKNYFLIAWRNLKSKKFYSLINILGLAVGIFCCILIFLYVQDELSYDKFNEKADRIYRVATNIKFGGRDFHLAANPAPMAFTLKKDYPEVEQAVRFIDRGSYLVRYHDRSFKEDKVVYADSTLFDVFSFHFVRGNPKTALRNPNSVVLTQQLAQKYFGTIDAIGKTLRFDDRTDMEVTGVVKELPNNSHFNFSIYASMSSLEDSRENNWLSNNYITYIVLKRSADPNSFEHKLNSQIVKNYVMPQAYQVMDITKEQMQASGNKVDYFLQPLTHIHLYSNLTAELGVNGNIQYIYLFSAIAIFVLLIACINFMNLSTARSAGRAQEVGVRKVLGSGRGQLVGQFLFESVLMSVIAFIIAIAGAQVGIPYFNELSGKNFDLAIFTNPELMVFLTISALVTGLLAGVYPAFFLSSFEPVKILKGKIALGVKSGSLRSTLVIVQFAISIILIIGTLVIYRQLRYIQQKNLGYNKEQVLILENAYVLGNKLQVFKENMKRNPEVTNVTVTSYLPVPSARSDTPFYTGAKMTNDNSVSMQYWAVDYDYISTMKMEMAEGRNFRRDMPTDSSAIIINQKAAGLFGFKNPIGKEIRTLNGLNPEDGYTAYHIIGVVKDFNYESLRKNVGALCMHLGRSRGLVAVRFDAAQTSDIIQKAKVEWNKLAPNAPFSYTFMNSRFDSVYKAEKRMGKIVAIFSVLAIFVACLGLFAMAAYTAEQRTKEIGVRKVLGATVWDIIRLLSTDYAKLVFFGFVLAVPLAWYSMHEWLQDFAYRIDLSVWFFAGAGLVTMLVALLTVSWQSVRAALINPVNSLRSE
ncbi:MAG: ABC transporter permease [Balneolaceae bacterium]|jgi:putative ABC transport system permease protein